MIRPAHALGATNGKTVPQTPELIEYLTRQQLAAPLLIAPPGGFPVTEQVGPAITDARITYHGAVTNPGGWWQWVKEHETAVIVTALALFALALISQGKGRRRR